jgi:hypothetical protein
MTLRLKKQNASTVATPAAGSVQLFIDPNGLAKTKDEQGVVAPIGSGGGSSTGNAGGDLSGTFPNPTVSKVNGTSVSGTPTNSGQIIISVSASAATWQNIPSFEEGPASQIATSGPPVDIGGNSPSTGQILVAESPTSASWQTIASNVSNNLVWWSTIVAADMTIQPGYNYLVTGNVTLTLPLSGSIGDFGVKLLDFGPVIIQAAPSDNSLIESPSLSIPGDAVIDSSTGLQWTGTYARYSSHVDTGEEEQTTWYQVAEIVQPLDLRPFDTRMVPIFVNANRQMGTNELALIKNLSGAITLELPSSSILGYRIGVKMLQAGTVNIIPAIGSGQTIEGLSSITLTAIRDVAIFQSVLDMSGGDGVLAWVRISQ